jgi:hypothetical protein
VKRTIRIALLAALLGAASPAGAQADQARVLFEAGAQAYEAGQYPAAIQAFEQAYRLSARPGVLFSIAQARRKQFFATKNRDELRAAIKGYRDYLAQVAQGGRRSDAAAALAELEPFLGKDDLGALAAPAAQATRLMVSSQTAGAVISLDGGKPLEVPLIAEVKPGKHTLRISASGYFEETREIEVGAGSVAALDLPLREKPGRLSLRTLPGAQVTLDGRLVAQTPLTQPLDVEPGRHLLGISKNGYRAWAHEIEVGRDEPKSLEIPLESTTQRKASYVLFGVGAGSVVAGGILAALAVHEQQIAVDFQNKQVNGNARCSNGSASACADWVKTDYTRHVNNRDDYRRDAGIALGAGVVLGAASAALFVMDFPSLLGVMPRSRDDRPKSPAPRERPMEVSAAPLLGPGLYGVSFGGAF